MKTQSLWKAYAGTTKFPSLKNFLKTDVAIIGGGITGVTTAHLLSEKGFKVAVLEKEKIGAGTTSYSTGNLYNTVGENLGMLQTKYDLKTIVDILNSRASAVDLIEKFTNDFSIDCDFHRRPWYMYSASDENNSRIEKEVEAAREANLSITEASDAEIPFDTQRAIKMEGQAQINPMQYVQGLANSLDSTKCDVFEQTNVREIKEHGGYLECITDEAIVQADHVIHATHTPKGIKFVHTLLGPYREYGVACRTEEQTHPDGIFWGYFEGKDKISTRTYRRNGIDYLIAVGRPHKTGQADSNVQHINYLKNFLSKHFKVKEFTYEWGGQHYRPADNLPYIGRDQKDSNIYIATGFSTDGLVWGTLAGSIISDLIAGEPNEYSDVFDATRNQPLKAAKEFVTENLNVAKQYIKTIPGTIADEDYANVAAGEGKVIEKDGQKIAVYKDEKGKVQACSAVCTHMACIVNWNNAEKSWDCPCHASRFATDGEVLEGPALDPLSPINIDEENR